MAGYSPRIAFDDLVEGAFRARNPARKHREAGVGRWWQALLLALSGLAQSIDMLVREPFRASDLPADWAWFLPVANLVLLPLLAIAVGFISWTTSTVGAWIILRRRLRFGQIGTATTLGLWSAVLPTVAVILLCLAAGVRSEIVGGLVAVIGLGHVIPSLAETGGLTISRAFLAAFVGPLLLFLALVLLILAGGLLAKLAGFTL